MGKLTGLIKFTGKIDGLSFYEMNGKIIVRKTGGFDGEKIKNSQKFVRVRENSSEFAQSARVGKYFRSSIALYLKKMRIPYVHNAIVCLFQEITKLDIISDRGQRKVANGIRTLEGIKAVKAFEFDKTVAFSSIFPFECRVDFANEKLRIEQFTIARIKKPESASHVRLRFMFVGLDFELHDHFILNESAVFSFDMKTAHPETLSLDLPCAIPSSSIAFGLLFIEFVQKVNGDDFVLRDCCLKIVDVVEL
jgi:hypothetical protein